MDIQIVDTAAVTEPITLEEAKAYLQIDADYASNDSQISLALSTARKRIESYLNIGLIKRTVKVFWDGSAIELPLSPNGAITSVKNGDTVITDYQVQDLPAKKIFVNSISNGNWFYSLSGYVEFTPSYLANNNVYVCEYETGYDELPSDLKQSILAECAYLYQLRGMPITDLISPNAYLLANSYSRNLVL